MTPDQLRRIAQAATEGPWNYQPWSTYALPSGDYAESILLANAAEDGEIVRGLCDEDGEFIATFNPAMVLELLDQIEQLQAVVRDKHDECTYQTRLAAVEKLHKREEIDYCDDPECCDLTPSCAECLVNWPCPTIKAARGE